MLKSIITTFLLLAFAVQTFSAGLIVADYFANTAAYNKNCENKAKPQLRCNGKCAMMKKLQQEEKKEQQNSGRKGDNKAETLLDTQTAFAEVPYCAYGTSKTLYPLVNDGNTYAMPRAVFHPPGA